MIFAINVILVAIRCNNALVSIHFLREGKIIRGPPRSSALLLSPISTAIRPVFRTFLVKNCRPCSGNVRDWLTAPKRSIHVASPAYASFARHCSNFKCMYLSSRIDRSSKVFQQQISPGCTARVYHPVNRCPFLSASLRSGSQFECLIKSSLSVRSFPSVGDHSLMGR